VPPADVPLVTGADVEAAAALLDGVVRRTPLEHSRALAERVGGPVWLKCENLQHTGSFKFRGAYTRISRLTDAERARGVVAASAGNHAQGVALAARMLGAKATVFMPETAPLPKVAATKAYGAEINLLGQTLAEPLVAAAEFAERTGAVFVHPFEHRDTIAGQGTVGLEILEDVPDADVVVVPVGGGGLIAGVSTAVAGRARVIGVEPELSSAMHDALAADEPVPVDPISVADGLNAPFAGTHGLESVRAHVEEVVLVTEAELDEAMRFLYARAKLACEPAGAASTAALLAGKVPLKPGETVVAVVSGGNVAAATAAAILAGR